MRIGNYASNTSQGRKKQLMFVVWALMGFYVLIKQSSGLFSSKNTKIGVSSKIFILFYSYSESLWVTKESFKI